MKSIFNDEYKKIVKSLKKARLEKSISQKKLSELLGYSQSYISKIEQGQIRLDIVQLKQISKVLGKNIRDFMG